MSSVERRVDARPRSAGAGAADRTADAQSASPAPCVTILLCTYNGAEFLTEQLASIERQSHATWQLIVSDDGSIDATLDIIARFAERTGRAIEVRSGPQRGACANFMSLIADPAIRGDYFAFCDQDDVWDRDKLAAALAWMQRVPTGMPAVYGARTRIISADGRPLGCSPLFTRPPSFANALVQSIAGANTMLLNAAAKRLLEAAGPVDVISHDWWAYQLVSGSGGLVHYDAEPHLDYRQHAGNRIGTNTGIRARLKRLLMALDGEFTRWNDANVAALQCVRHLLTAEACDLLDAYETMRKGSLTARVKVFATSPMRRQTPLGNAGLLAAVVLRKI